MNWLAGCWYYLNDSHYKKKLDRLTNDCAHSENCTSFIAHYHFDRTYSFRSYTLTAIHTYFSSLRLKHEKNKNSARHSIAYSESFINGIKIGWYEKGFAWLTHSHTKSNKMLIICLTFKQLTIQPNTMYG